MRDTGNELAQIIGRFAEQYIEKYQPNSFIIRTLDALQQCRTLALGGHKEKCDCCDRERISYNSCRNRHCPKCQAAKQAFWVEDRMKEALTEPEPSSAYSLPGSGCRTHPQGKSETNHQTG
ncbi:MAG: transposase zinc-binding domain-containing protein [Bacteroidales bacterium]|nr:transposase zinc-binding domain-containing protein [Bacteroidales bacterium]